MRFLRIFAVLVLGSAAFGQQARSVTVDSAPAAGSQASASIAAADNLRHVVDRVCFSASSIVAPVLTQLTVVIRDGATGAGTVLSTFAVAISATTGQNQPPFCTDNLLIEGSNKTATTVEWSASLANLSETATLFYHNVPQ